MIKEGDLVMIVKCSCSECRTGGRCNWPDIWVGVVGRLKLVQLSDGTPARWCVSMDDGALTSVAESELLWLEEEEVSDA